MVRRAEQANYNLDSVDRMMAVVSAVEALPDQSLADIASRCLLSDSTTLRYLMTLAKHGLVERNAHNATFRLGLRLFRLGNVAIAQRDVLRIVVPVMERLVEQHEESVNFAARQQTQVVLLKVLESPNPLRKGARAGETDSWHATALGKALLASMELGDVHLLLGEAALPAYTPNTLSSRESLLGDLKSIRERGYSIDDEESVEGLRCVATSVRDHDGTPSYALSVSGPKSRMSYARIQQIGGSLISAAAALSKSLGAS